ncbi:hypothetical protein DNTS_030870 [Danionella cerebrum]|uniref:Uncharacterized protein n=1 Tax=Danionella cerebrum TaxID=2873325 RepID=A0A553RMX1_9TELE|nr:hypothetical protein DNTS_030870 [Danionella translucida]
MAAVGIHEAEETKRNVAHDVALLTGLRNSSADGEQHVRADRTLRYRADPCFHPTRASKLICTGQQAHIPIRLQQDVHRNILDMI